MEASFKKSLVQQKICVQVKRHFPKIPKIMQGRKISVNKLKLRIRFTLSWAGCLAKCWMQIEQEIDIFYGSFCRYSVMGLCWKVQPQDRPTFAELVVDYSCKLQNLAGYTELLP